MNLPNKITLSRVLLIPIFIVFMIADFGWGTLSFGGITMSIETFVGAILFVIASMTDWLDGYLARKHNLVTNMGKFLDPLADKLLVAAAFILLVEMGLAPAWVVIFILSREFAVTGLRLVLVGEGEVVAASSMGKIKTVTQLVAIIVLLFHNAYFELLHIPFGTIMLYVALFFTVLSGIDYFYKNRHALTKSM